MEKGNHTLEEVTSILYSFVRHKDPRMREAVAELGYGIGELINDPDKDVRAVANAIRHMYVYHILVRARDTIEMLVEHNDANVRAEVLKHGYGIEKLIKDPDNDVREKAQLAWYGSMTTVCQISTRDKFEEMIKSEFWKVRLEVAKYGYGLRRLVDDPAPSVRAAVAKRGYGLTKLINDPSHKVRDEVERQLKLSKQT